MVKIDLITGFLGAGKTTFIRNYAEYLMRKGKISGFWKMISVQLMWI